MASQNARLTFLRVIEEHEAEWSWYQFERAFPPGWFTDELPATRANDILDELERDGLVTTTLGGPQPKYRLTAQGTDALRTGTVRSVSG
jgi:hypothetical protein